MAPDRPIALAGSMSANYSWIPGKLSPDPRYFPTAEQAADNYREMAEALANAGAELIILEMMLDVERGSRVAAAAAETGLPVWAGVSCSRLPDGSAAAWNIHLEEEEHRVTHQEVDRLSLATVIDAMKSFDPQVMGIMHSKVEAMPTGLEVLFDQWSGPVMAYAETNVGRDVEPDEYSSLAHDWVAGGVQIVGGCCGTTIEHIRAMVGALPKSVGSRPA